MAGAVQHPNHVYAIFDGPVQDQISAGYEVAQPFANSAFGAGRFRIKSSACLSLDFVNTRIAAAAACEALVPKSANGIAVGWTQLAAEPPRQEGLGDDFVIRAVFCARHSASPRHSNFGHERRGTPPITTRLRCDTGCGPPRVIGVGLNARRGLRKTHRPPAPRGLDLRGAGNGRHPEMPRGQDR